MSVIMYIVYKKVISVRSNMQNSYSFNLHKKINNANNMATSLSLLADIHVDFQCISSILHRAHEGSVFNAIIYSKTGL